MSLERFKIAQASSESGHETALAELRAGRKTSHWIWYVFPQLASLGRSDTARFYGIKDPHEACDYVRDPLLRSRLLLVTETALAKLSAGVSLGTLMGSAGDCQKIVSSLTLFEEAARRVVAEDTTGECRRLMTACSAVLAIAEQAGLARCEITDAAWRAS